MHCFELKLGLAEIVPVNLQSSHGQSSPDLSINTILVCSFFEVWHRYDLCNTTARVKLRAQNKPRAQVFAAMFVLKVTTPPFVSKSQRYSSIITMAVVPLGLDTVVTTLFFKS